MKIFITMFLLLCAACPAAIIPVAYDTPVFAERSGYELTSLTTSATGFTAVSDGTTAVLQWTSGLLCNETDTDVFVMDFDFEAIKGWPAGGVTDDFKLKFAVWNNGTARWTNIGTNRGSISGDYVLLSAEGHYTITFTYTSIQEYSCTPYFVLNEFESTDSVKVSNFRLARYVASTYADTANGFIAPYPNLSTVNGCWNQWVEPHAIKVGNKIYYGGVSTRGYVMACCYDITDNTLQTGTLGYVYADDHNGPSFYYNSAGYVEVYYSAHSGALRWAKSANPGDVRTWGTPVVIDSETDYTYTQIFGNGDNRWLYSRSTDDAVQGTMLVSTDAGANWTKNSSVDFEYVIHKQLTATTLAVGYNEHPFPHPTKDQNVYYYELDLTTGNCTIPGNTTPFANYYTDNVAIADANDHMLEIFTATTDPNQYTRLYDVSKNNEAIVAVFTEDTEPFSDAVYHYITWTSAGVVTDNTIVAAGPAIYADAETDTVAYFAGACLSGTPGVVYVSRNDTGVWFLERYTTADAGANWTVDVLARYADRKVLRPYVPTNASADVPVLYLLGDPAHDDDGYTTYLAYRTYINLLINKDDAYYINGDPTATDGGGIFGGSGLFGGRLN